MLHLFAAVLAIGLHHIVVEQFVTFKGLLVVAGKLVEVMEALVGRHADARLVAVGGLVEVDDGEAVVR